MMPEHVVDYFDEQSGQRLKLDFNNGFLYDLNGNQVAKASVVESQYNALLADIACHEAHKIASASLASAHFDKNDVLKARANAGWERLVRMDLGVGDVFQSQAAITNYASGYRNEQPVADVYSPPLLVDKPASKYYEYSKDDAFQRALPMGGAAGAGVSEISARLSSSQFSTVEYAIGGFVPTEIEAAADTPLRIRQATLKRIQNAMVLEREIRVSTLATTAGSWDSSVQRDLSGDATKKWNGGASSDPVADLHAILESSWGECSGIIMSRPAYNAFVRNDKVKAYYGYKDGAAPIPNATQASALLDLPPIFPAKMRYKNTSGGLTYCWGNNVVLFRMPEEMPPQSQDDIASSYTFRWRTPNVKDGVASNGFVVREFFVQDRGPLGGNKLVMLAYDAEVQTSKFVGGIIIGAYQ